MPRNSKRRLPLLVLALVGSVVEVAGCATWQGPRIDPTGERLFVWPNEPSLVAPVPVGAPPIFTPAPIGAGPIVGPAPAAPVVQPLPSMAPSTPFGNVVAPPVYSDPPGVVPAAPLVGPGPGVPIAAPPPLPPPPVIAPQIPAGPALPMPPPPGIAAAPVLPSAGVAPIGRDYLRVSPSGLVAAVGSEMLLKAGIVAREGHLVANQRVDWTVARTGVGQFTELGFRDLGQLWGFFEAPRKVDDWTATTTTAVVPITLYTSTPNPNDNVPIFRGESWVTVTSASEGTSVVAAHAPAYREFNQATSTIYWIDAQWVFPQPAIVELGRPHTLTTTLMRRTDGVPLAGWIVRYDVSGGASLGYEGGNFVESTTDAAGRASVEVSPKDAGGGGAINVGITIVRPQTAGPAVMPRLELGRGVATISWTAAAPLPVVPIAPGIPGGPVPLPAPPTFSPPPTLPPVTNQPAPAPAPNAYTPPAAATGQPRLEASLRAAGTDQVAVGEFAAFELTVTNRGDGVARNILVTDRFDRGLRHQNAQPNEYMIKYSGMRDLQPNESQMIRLTFQVVDGGKQCHEATVTADGAEAVSKSGCIMARQAALEVSITGPRSRVVGETAEFSAVVKNVGDVAATNIEMVIRCDAAIVPTKAEAGSVSLADGGILLKIDRLEPAERRTFGMNGECRGASNRACARAIVTADGGVNQAAEACVEILSPLSNAAPGATAAPAVSNLRLTVAVTKNPARVGEKQLINVVMENAGQQVERQVDMRVLLPREFTLDPTAIQPQSEATVLGNEIRFTRITDLATGQQRRYLIPVTPNRTGRVQVRAEIAAPSLTPPKSFDSEVIEITAASP